MEDAKIERQTLGDQVFDRLWAMISDGVLAPGDFMPSERDLMTRFGVGRPAVREAMQRLAGRGLITVSQGERSRVNAPSASAAIGQVDQIAQLMLSSAPENLEHLKAARRILECGTAGLAARAIAAGLGAQDARRLRGLIEDQRRAMAAPQGFIAADIAFHVALSELTGNPILRAATEAMLRWLQSYYAPLLHWSGREEVTLSEHGRLVDLIEAGDAAGAEALMGAHLDRSAELYRAGAEA